MSITIEALIERMEWAARCGLTEFQLSENGTHVALRRETATAATGTAPDTASPDPESVMLDATSDMLPLSAPQVEAGIEAPLSGLCYLSPQPDAPAFVGIGDRVKPGQTICLIEAMKVMTSVTADRDGIIEDIRVADGDTVEAGTLLMKVRT
ncbi:biotin/lipoyl-containing protein [Phaeobacter sp. B1627]|uniref:acetyl-CoA carboxylase biotin carboxyl carrier protein n=1 Tax=Phaeobacter sp. B1627 TaxID=2583809 RepID=UPI0011195E3D|nr:biotin/lipoyl-containing protein [Phaeobacter sp. B1627]TNJ43284.1 acetyl-CoA carboxylase biotin carboxyl carrier protein [Phaeobacter sp. B1627]